MKFIVLLMLLITMMISTVGAGLVAEINEIVDLKASIVAEIN